MGLQRWTDQFCYAVPSALKIIVHKYFIIVGKLKHTSDLKHRLYHCGASNVSLASATSAKLKTSFQLLLSSSTRH